MKEELWSGWRDGMRALKGIRALAWARAQCMAAGYCVRVCLGTTRSCRRQGSGSVRVRTSLLVREPGCGGGRARCEAAKVRAAAALLCGVTEQAAASPAR